MEEEIPEDDGTVTAAVRDEEGPALSAADLGLMRLEMEKLNRTVMTLTGKYYDFFHRMCSLITK